MAKVTWNGVVIAESDKVEKVEGNYYFPADSLKQQYFKKSNSQTTCFWKGVASYYDLEMAGQIKKDAAWYYPNPSKAAKHIKNHVAFYSGGGVKIESGSSTSTGAAPVQAEESFISSLKRLIRA